MPVVRSHLSRLVKYYHLQAPGSSGVKVQQKIAGSVLVARPRAQGIYNERAILFAIQAQPLEVNRYHYHLWALPPTDMIQSHARVFLSRAGLADKVHSDSRQRNNAAMIEISLKRFEQIKSQQGSTAKVSMQIRLEHNNKYSVYDYEEVINAGDNSMHSLAVAFSQALDSIFTKFVTQLK